MTMKKLKIYPLKNSINLREDTTHMKVFQKDGNLLLKKTMKMVLILSFMTIT